MYQGGQRHVLGNDPSRAYQVPPPPPPMSPPVMGATMTNLMGGMPLPPPPPRYGPSQGAATGSNSLIPPPPSGPPPGSALNQQPPWHGQFGRQYDGRSGFSHQSTGPQQHAPYNPKLHAQVAAGQTVSIPTPPASDLVGSTYIPNGDTFSGGFPAFGHEESTLSLNSQSSYPPTLTPKSTTDPNVTTPLDDTKERFQPSTTPRANDQSSSANAIPQEVIAQWPIDTVLIWLAKNQFSKEWQETFKALDISGSQFLDMGVKKGSPKTSQMLHLHVYPRLKEECLASGKLFDQVKEREEVRRMRRLIKYILTGKTLEPTKTPGLQVRKTSTTSGNGGASLPSAGTDPGDSPIVSLPFLFLPFLLLSSIKSNRSLMLHRHHLILWAPGLVGEDRHKSQLLTLLIIDWLSNNWMRMAIGVQVQTERICSTALLSSTEP